MALVVFLRGLNVGGHRNFRPSMLAKNLQHLDIINIGAAGTFVVRQKVSRAMLRDEIASRLPFNTAIMICEGREIGKLLLHRFEVDNPERADTVCFVSILSRIPRVVPQLPIIFPPSGRWLLKVLARDGRFVFGVYKRDVKVIGYLRRLDQIFRVPTTTRNWNTMTRIAKVLSAGAVFLCASHG